VFKLQRYFSIASAVAIIVVTVAFAFLYRQNAVTNLSRIIEVQNVGLAQSFANIIWPRYEAYVTSITRIDIATLRARAETPEIHETLKALTTGLPVLKVKMYSLDGITVYSSEFTEIGDSKKGNAGFEATVRQGVPSTKSSFRETFLSFHGEVRNRHLIESYLPIRGPDGKVEGVFELYADVTPLIGEIGERTTTVVLYLLVGLGLLYAVLYLIVRRADGIMRHQYVELEHEVAERKSTEDKYKVAKETAERASLVKSEFLAAMSHEVRTPMAGIIGMSDLLLDTGMSRQQSEWTTAIKTSGQNLLTILNEILDQSKLDAGMLDIAPVNFSLAALIDETTRMFEPKIEEKGLALETGLAVDLPDAINADRMRIGQVLSNLLSNALKFTETGKISVVVNHRMIGDDDFMLRIAVSDTGIGLSQDQQSRLFSAFVQADSSTSRTYGGTGLGLSISKQLAEMMGGEIGVESTGDVGSTFWYTVRCGPATGELEAPVDQSAVEEWQAVRSLNFLVAEDNTVNQQLITAIFESLGHRVVVADDGRKAVEALTTTDFDLVIMDVRMPVMDGLEATKIIRRLDGDKSRVPIIALTADVAAQNIKGYLEDGIDEVCAKPLDLRTLLRAINAQLGDEVHTSTKKISPRQTETELGPAATSGSSANIEFADFDGVLRHVADLVDRTVQSPTVALPPGTPGLTDESFAQMRASYRDQLQAQCDKLKSLHARLARNPDDEKIVEDVKFIAHSLKGGGATFGYDLVTGIAGDLDIHLKPKLALNQHDIRYLACHIEALSLIAVKEISGAGGEAGHILQQGLESHRPKV